MKLPPELVAQILATPGVVVTQVQPMPAGQSSQITLPKMSESEFTALVIGEARSTGWRTAHFRSVRVQRKDGSFYWQTPVQGDGAGFVDLLMVRRKRIVAAELKVGKNKASADQTKWLSALAEANVECYVWTPEMWADIKSILA